MYQSQKEVWTCQYCGIKILRKNSSSHLKRVHPDSLPKYPTMKPGNFNFDDLFKDFDDEFFKDLKGHFAQHFSSHKMQHESAGGHFDFADVNFEEFFNSPFGQHEDSDMFGKDMDMFGSSSKVKREMKNGQNCKTVTQKVGNMVTTYTHCS